MMDLLTGKNVSVPEDDYTKDDLEYHDMAKPRKGKQKMAEPGPSKEVAKATQGKKSKFKTKVTKTLRLRLRLSTPPWDAFRQLGSHIKDEDASSDQWLGIGGCNLNATDWFGMDSCHIEDLPIEDAGTSEGLSSIANGLPTSTPPSQVGSHSGSCRARKDAPVNYPSLPTSTDIEMNDNGENSPLPLPDLLSPNLAPSVDPVNHDENIPLPPLDLASSPNPYQNPCLEIYFDVDCQKPQDHHLQHPAEYLQCANLPSSVGMGSALPLKTLFLKSLFEEGKAGAEIRITFVEQLFILYTEVVC
ncbi:hypothetical protein APHAL10511_003356 [Amanita phalloides]|nr:hypothetical protein APHAL10511_003356 [Amanita phalloides]